MSAKSFLSADERDQVKTAIGQAEERTAAEIVCALATESGRYDRAEAILGMLLAVVGLLAANLITGWVDPAHEWDHATPAAFPWQVLGAVAGFVLGNVIASYVHGLRRLFVSPAERRAELGRSAAFVFSQQRLASTRGRGGVLIYVSLFERQVLVQADQGAFAVLGQEGVDALRDLAVERLRAGDRLGTFQATVAKAADLLSEALPCEADDQQELSDELLVYHPRP